MPTDDERRQMSDALRRCVKGREYVGDDVMAELVRSIAVSVGLAPDADPTAQDLCDRLADLIEPEEITGEASDGYHTFDELYDHRARLFSVIVRDHRELAWKSMLHHDGTMYDGMFIVGIETPDGQATYHYDVDPYWDLFDCEVLDRAPEWDGHTPRQAIDRIAALGPSCDREALLRLADEMDGDTLAVPLVYGSYQSGYIAAMGDCARRIREALGEVGR